MMKVWSRKGKYCSLPLNLVIDKSKIHQLSTSFSKFKYKITFRIRKAMSDIYYGRVDHPWAIDIESWPEQPAREVDRLQGYQASINQHVASLG